MKFQLQIILITALISVNCECFIPTTDKARKELVDKTDLIFLGTPISNFTKNEANGPTHFDTNLDFLFVIDSIIKGTSLKDTIAIIQYANGMCKDRFKIGERQLIFAYQINTIELSKDFEWSYNDTLKIAKNDINLYNNYLSKKANNTIFDHNWCIDKMNDEMLTYLKNRYYLNR